MNLEEKKNYCNKKGICTLVDADNQRCEFWYVGRNKYCKYEKKISADIYNCTHKKARKEAGCND